MNGIDTLLTTFVFELTKSICSRISKNVLNKCISSLSELRDKGIFESTTFNVPCWTSIQVEYDDSNGVGLDLLSLYDKSGQELNMITDEDNGCIEALWFDKPIGTGSSMPCYPENVAFSRSYQKPASWSQTCGKCSNQNFDS